ncbi:hypothetical protein Y032_0182g879 [Ancylostoma ceylanicum]|uniref:Uncharacterized protein n=1 Tax=Ancylostoma ceylanicum TaxID=53326 RepID=A0A016SSN7_9BILA|nr:hypothetical protein Y032_0182g879 [Ancylostoma ceylanicum]
MTTPIEAVVIVVGVRSDRRTEVPQERILIGIQRIGSRRASICMVYCPIGPESDAHYKYNKRKKLRTWS